MEPWDGGLNFFGCSRTIGPFAGGLVEALRTVRATLSGVAVARVREMAPLCGKRNRGIVADMVGNCS